MNSSSPNGFRVAVLAFAVLLAAESGWLLLAELAQPGFDRLPTDARAASAAANQRIRATWAASIGVIRGDLWAEAAFTDADLLWKKDSKNSYPPEDVRRADENLNRAIEYAPSQPDVWLLLAGLALRYTLPKVNITEALMMSYYTGPTDYHLMPLRISVATQLPAFDDPALREMIGRDLRVLARRQRAAIVEAYQGASPAGKNLIKKTIGEFDPTALGGLEPRGPKMQ